MTEKTAWIEMLGGEIGYVEGEYTTRFLRAGEGDEPPLVFLHGLGGHAEAYVRNVRAIGEVLEDREVYAIDFIGHGYSSAPADIEYSIPDLMDHVEDFVTAIGYESAHVHGESLGGWVAGKLGIDRPNLVESVGLNTTGGIRESIPESVTDADKDQERAEIKDLYDRTMKMLEEGCPREHVENRVDWLFLDDAPEEVVDIRHHVYQQERLQRVMETIYNSILLDFEQDWYLQPEELESLEVPVHIVHSEGNPGTHIESIEYVHDLLPNSIYNLYSNSAHWPQYEEAGRFNSDTIEFLRNQS